MKLTEVIAQLPIPITGQDDCGPTASLSAVNAASGGLLIVKPLETRIELVRHLRAASGNTRGPTGLDDLDLGVTKGLAPAAAAVGLKPFSFRTTYSWKELVNDGLDNADAVVVTLVWYAVVVRLRPDLAGQLVGVQFDHWIAAQGLATISPGVSPRKATLGDYRPANRADFAFGGKYAGRTPFTRVTEGLLDGRRSDLAKGPQMYPLALLRDATAATRWYQADGSWRQYGPGIVAAGIITSPGAIE